jgi:restriction endonuclease-like protein
MRPTNTDDTKKNSSLDMIAFAQSRWAKDLSIPLERDGYVKLLADNLFLGHLNPETRAEFESADGGELNDTQGRPAKMRALISSSALAVNFFDAWRLVPNEPLAAALDLGESILRVCFEYKCTDYPIGPRSPNLDVMLTTTTGRRIAIECKFLEAYRNPGRREPLSEKYFPSGPGVWTTARLHRAQALANDESARWNYLDASQLLKHLLGLRSDKSPGEVELLYLWYDTGLDDAIAHREEIERFAALVKEDNADDAVQFRSMTYQELFGALVRSEAALPAEWVTYMSRRYFQGQ